MRTLFLKTVTSVAIMKMSAAFGQNMKPFSDINYNPVSQVSISPYKSVQLRNNQTAKIALGVAISGGGSRAEYFGLGALLELEKVKLTESSRNFLNEIDYFSTVSGGCFAAGYYLTIKKNLLKNTLLFNDFFFTKDDKYEDFVGKKAGMLQILRNNHNETINDNYPMADRLDYEILQYDADDKEQKYKFNSQMLMSDFFIPITSNSVPTLPMFIPNGTVYNNGERLPFMPHIISGLRVTKSLIPNKADLPLKTDGTNDGYNFPLTYAITASSAFPGVLPKTKFAVKDTSKVLCVVDGGIADNLGYITLLETLNSDNTVENINKKSLIIDCSSDGAQGQLIDDEKISVKSLIEKALLYTVQSKYISYKNDINIHLKYYDMKPESCVVIGFSTILSKLREMPDNKEYIELKNKFASTKDNNKQWYTLYKDFYERFKKNATKTARDGQPILSSLSTDSFGEFTKADVFLLYEYAAQVETKLKIYPDEREMLLLAGRYAVYLKNQQIKSLLVLK